MSTKAGGAGALRDSTLSPGLRMALDFGPLAVFFLTNLLAPVPPEQKVFVATATFMAATAIAMLASRLWGGGVSPMLLFSGAMVLGLGGLTLWLQDATFIKVKPTIYYVMLSAILFFGLWSGRPTLKLVLGQAYPGLTDRGWTILSRNWACFFLVAAAGNEIAWRSLSTGVWISYKLWGVFPATILFALANLPVLMRHGMNPDTAEKAELEQLPPTG